MTDEEHESPSTDRLAVVATTSVHVHAGGAPAPTPCYATQPFSMSPELELLCAWLDAG